ncbi:flagellar basal-body rod protein FlgF [Thiorhodospira sibirica]|uniref:flagellar basal-body rod protein FlgF n=1 Tax=Thiorhodospira sibirica TaxID=154347 RepID=UPI00022C527A|nr:flagellar basal-body rod protein FlgF [Thiorhodospira sibirica]
MDRMLYIAMSGARENMHAQAVNAHNIANVSTVGFKATLDAYTNHPVHGPVYDSRVYTQAQSLSTDFSPGPMLTTGRDLDVAIQGDGWIAVQTPEGGEGYTRAGDLQVDAFGLLTTGTGLPVMGEAGPIAIPPDQQFEVGNDGTITIRPMGGDANALIVIDRIKLVNPDITELERGDDNLMRRADGGVEPADANVRLVSGVLEGSNVSTAASLVKMIETSRQFEMQIKMMKTAEEIDQSTAKLLALS